MVYLIGEIILWLFIAAAFGFIIGWLLRGQFIRKEETDKPTILETVSQPEIIKSPQKPITTVAKDDLKKIKGIGPYLEKKLNAMDIKTFLQISELNLRQVEKISGQIGAFPDRIVRDKWIEQAQRLSKNKDL